jgi:hypothetical protein
LIVTTNWSSALPSPRSGARFVMFTLWCIPLKPSLHAVTQPATPDEPFTNSRSRDQAARPDNEHLLDGQGVRTSGAACSSDAKTASSIPRRSASQSPAGRSRPRPAHGQKARCSLSRQPSRRTGPRGRPRSAVRAESGARDWA